MNSTPSHGSGSATPINPENSGESSRDQTQLAKSGRVALITGATSGIGEACARRFLAGGYHVIATGRQRSKLEALAGEFPQRLEIVVSDLEDPESLRALVRHVVASHVSLDVLVNAAGVIGFDTVAGVQTADLNRMFALNVTAPVLLMQGFLPLLEAAQGAVVNISSVAGTRAFPGIFSYCISKAAVDQATRCAALELAAQQIRVNAVNPGVVVTELHRRGGMADDAYRAFLEKAKTTHPLGRPGAPEEVADAIWFLGTPASSWITGVTLAVDGGRSETCLR